MIGNPVNRVHALLSTFRLLEAAGACTVIADSLSRESSAQTAGLVGDVGCERTNVSLDDLLGRAERRLRLR
jgi:hypothetical protein